MLNEEWWDRKVKRETIMVFHLVFHDIAPRNIIAFKSQILLKSVLGKCPSGHNIITLFVKKIHRAEYMLALSIDLYSVEISQLSLTSSPSMSCTLLGKRAYSTGPITSTAHILPTRA